MNQPLNSQNTSHISPWWASYGMSFVRIWEKTDCIITALHHIVLLNGKTSLSHSPASGGPAVIGMEAIPSIHPMPWAAPCGPNKSKAMGPMRQIKHPSAMPIIKVIMMSGQKSLARGIQAVTMPSTRNAHCCIRIRFTEGKSATLPKMSRLTADVMPIHMTKVAALAWGMRSFVCFTW